MFFVDRRVERQRLEKARVQEERRKREADAEQKAAKEVERLKAAKEERAKVMAQKQEEARLEEQKRRDQEEKRRQAKMPCGSCFRRPPLDNPQLRACGHKMCTVSAHPRTRRARVC